MALHEGVAVTAASFYAQATGRTAVANLHVAPGLGNAIGAMYGALKASSPLLVTAGQQDTRMQLRNPLLSHDLVAMAAPVTKFSAEPATADELGPLLQRAFKIAMEPPCGPVFLALPVNVMEQETQIAATTSGRIHHAIASEAAITDACQLILNSKNPCIIAGDDPASSGAFDALVTLAELMGAAVYQEGLRAQVTFPNRHPSFRGRVPFTAKETRRLLEAHDLVLLLGGPFFEDVWFDDINPIPDSATLLQIENSETRLAQNFALECGIVGELAFTLNALNSSLRSADQDYRDAAAQRNHQLSLDMAQAQEAAGATLEKLWDAQPMAPARAISEINDVLPEGCIVVDESITTSLEVGGRIEHRQPGDYYAGRGGGIGQGIAGAIGVQIAYPDRPVIALSGDGSAMYSIQALWTAAHHNLPIVFVILSNREYRVLKHNLDIYRHRFEVGSNKPYPHMDLTNPELDFAGIARGMGVGGECVTDADDIGAAITRGFASDGPYLLEIVISSKP